jgi:hypothetical protein
MPTHIDPRTVLSPRNSVRNVNVIFDGGLWDDDNPRWSGWSVAELIWDGNPAVGVRWNGILGENVGSPQSRGLPTWFIMPEALKGITLDRISQHIKNDNSDEPAEIIPPRRRLLDLISFVRAASDEELASMIDQMGLGSARVA